MPGADYFSFGSPPPPPPAQPSAVGAGQVKVALILPLSAPGNGAAVAQSMRNAAEMALAEFSNPDIQLLVKDDGGSAGGAQQAAQQALAEGAEIILGPLFAVSVQGGRADRAVARRAGDRVLDRLERGGARRASVELPAGDRCRSRHRLRDPAGQALVRGAHSRQCLRHRGAGRVPAGGRARRRPRRRDGALSARPRADAGAGAARRAGRAPGRHDLHSGRRRRRRPPRCRCSPPMA